MLHQGDSRVGRTNRSKESLALDPKRAAAVEALRPLIGAADIFEPGGNG
jgi:hypothetical protein